MPLPFLYTIFYEQRKKNGTVFVACELFYLDGNYCYFLCRLLVYEAQISYTPLAGLACRAEPKQLRGSYTRNYF